MFTLLFAPYFTGVVIEEITEEAASTSSEYSLKQPLESTGFCKSDIGKKVVDLTTNSECVQALKDDPEALRFVFMITKLSIRLSSVA